MSTVKISVNPRELAQLLGIDFGGKGSDAFALVMQPVTVLANGTASGTVQVSTEFGFVCTHAMAYITEAGTVVDPAEAPLTVNLNVSQSARSWTSRPAPVSTQFGTGQRPYYYGVPGVLVPGATLTADFQNLSADDHIIRAVFAGFRIYQFSAAGMR